MSIFRGALCLLFSFVFVPPALAHTGGSTVQSMSGPSGSLDQEFIGSTGMVNSPTAGTLGKNRLEAGFVFEYQNHDAIPADSAHVLHETGREIHGKRHEETYSFHLGYGVADDFDLYLSAPIHAKYTHQIEDHDNLGRSERADGFGDMQFTGKWRFLKKFVEGAVFAGIKFPTGETSDKDKGGAKFDAELQPGSGSWDGEFGIAFSRNFKRRLSAATSFIYTLKTEGGQEEELGDTFGYNIALAFALRELGEHPNLNLHIELNNLWARRDESRHMNRVLDSGGTIVSITPGISASLSENVSAFCAMPLPIYQNLGGQHEELEFELVTGISLVI